jgi:hypothetical protein
MRKSPIFWLLISLTAIALLTAFGPAEKTLGTNVRVVYLHGVWVWAALAGFLLAGLTGLAGLLTRRNIFHRWSRALGRTGMLFWITYIPISMWAMETNWNGLFLAEPRFRLAVVFAVGGLLLQAGLILMEDPVWASLGNLLYLAALLVALRTTQDVMHPPAPILNSDAWRIQFFFGALFLLTLFAAWHVARWWYHRELIPAMSDRGNH